jgi:ABC-type antimicrobial peptide transport system permease subunit
VLFDLAPFDPLIFAGVVAGFVLLAGVSCLWPIRRATRVDPIVALRAE